MYLLDTATLSETVAARPEPRVLAWIESHVETRLFTSVVVIGELRKGQIRVRDGRRSERLDAWLKRRIIPGFEGRILPVTLEVAERWGTMNGEASRQGSPLPPVDSLIAATAIVHNLTVVTRNVADFERCGARVLSPWADQR